MPYILLAAALDTAEKETPSYVGKGAGDVLSTIGLLLIMVAVIAGAYFLTKLIAGGAMNRQTSLGHMKVVDRLMLARDRAVVVVEVGDRFYMIGVSGTAINLLTEVEGAAYRQEAGKVPQRSFMETLQSKIKKPKSYKAPAETRAFMKEKVAPEQFFTPTQPKSSVKQGDDMQRMMERMQTRTQELKNRGEGNDGNAKE